MCAFEQSTGAAQGPGRYAPSPSGPLHLGSLIAALASFLHARSRGGAWLLRMEDIDPPREVPGAAADILRTLEAFGLTWDGPVVYQSQRGAAYDEALAALAERGATFACGCTRREARSGPPGLEGPIYPGTCRNGLPAGRRARSIRLRADVGTLSFCDGVQGEVQQHLADDIGDFVLRRGDGRVAYQLAVVVDDGFQQIAEVVRGADLLTSTPRQLWLQSQLRLPHPAYWHVPVLVDDKGRKLGKSTGAPALDRQRPGPTLWRALTLLGQAPPAELAGAQGLAVLDWALRRWNPEAVPQISALSR